MKRRGGKFGQGEKKVCFGFISISPQKAVPQDIPDKTVPMNQ